MKNTKAYAAAYLILCMIHIGLLAFWSYITIYGTEVIETYKWIQATLGGMFCFIMYFKTVKNNIFKSL